MLPVMVRADGSSSPVLSEPATLLPGIADNNFRDGGEFAGPVHGVKDELGRIKADAHIAENNNAVPYTTARSRDEFKSFSAIYNTQTNAKDVYELRPGNKLRLLGQMDEVTIHDIDRKHSVILALDTTLVNTKDASFMKAIGITNVAAAEMNLVANVKGGGAPGPANARHVAFMLRNPSRSPFAAPPGVGSQVKGERSGLRGRCWFRRRHRPDVGDRVDRRPARGPAYRGPGQEVR